MRARHAIPTHRPKAETVVTSTKPSPPSPEDNPENTSEFAFQPQHASKQPKVTNTNKIYIFTSNKQKELHKHTHKHTHQKYLHLPFIQQKKSIIIMMMTMTIITLITIMMMISYLVWIFSKRQAKHRPRRRPPVCFSAEWND